MKNLLTLVLLSTLVAVSGCQSAYYSAMEKVGVHKRDILVDRVEDVQGAQQDAQQEFKSALEQFQSVINFDGGELQAAYEALHDKYQDSLKAANQVSNHINQVENVAEDLFDEWEDELNLYQNKKLKAQSASKLRATKRQYDKLMRSMRQSESKMQPFLSALQDNVLYLKHNLNAHAIGALKGELSSIQRDVKALVADIELSIQESEKFIQSLQ
ncbi:DUF2959 domain-containing protein [Catenovulum sediminis]|uniref:DUF2959 domain-containing protein n=1 Tax=Catenovulum sediminis TaxID=1740262 RepID=A0ABV1RFY8_9ALTE